MPWKESTCMTQRREFVLLANVSDVNLSQLCERFGISRKTGYKWRSRFQTICVRPSSVHWQPKCNLSVVPLRALGLILLRS